jgi:hypothetical protein
VRKIHGKYPEFSRRCVGQRNAYGISVYDLAYVRRNRAQDLPQVEARCNSGREIQEQLKPLILKLKFCLCTHGPRWEPPNLLRDLNDDRVRPEVTSAGCLDSQSIAYQVLTNEQLRFSPIPVTADVQSLSNERSP